MLSACGYPWQRAATGTDSPQRHRFCGFCHGVWWKISTNRRGPTAAPLVVLLIEPRRRPTTLFGVCGIAIVEPEYFYIHFGCVTLSLSLSSVTEASLCFCLCTASRTIVRSLPSLGLLLHPGWVEWKCASASVDWSGQGHLLLWFGFPTSKPNQGHFIKSPVCPTYGHITVAHCCTDPWCLVVVV